DVQQRRLPRPRRADDGQEVAGRDVQVHVLESGHLDAAGAVDAGDASQADDWGVAHEPLPSAAAGVPVRTASPSARTLRAAGGPATMTSPALRPSRTSTWVAVERPVSSG